MLKMHRMKLNQLRDVSAVAELGSLRAAARKLGISQPAITRSIREIEHELGVALFERRAKGAILTPMGQVFLVRANAAQNELRQAREEIQQLKGVATGRVSIALSTVAHIALLPKVLQPFHERYPKIFMSLSEELYPSAEMALKNGTLDFYVGPLSEMPLTNDFSIERLFNNTRVVLGRKGHKLANAKSLRELVTCGWITTRVTRNTGAELGPLFERYGLPPPRVEMIAPSSLSMVMAASSSDLLMMLPRQWLDLPSTHELLHHFRIGEELPSAPICIVRRASLPLTPAAEFLCDLIRRASKHYSSSRKSVRATKLEA
jgi:DNA-binding transcriptional LysR family regulator